MRQEAATGIMANCSIKQNFQVRRAAAREFLVNSLKVGDD